MAPVPECEACSVQNFCLHGKIIWKQNETNIQVCNEKVPLPPQFEAPCSVQCGRSGQYGCHI